MLFQDALVELKSGLPMRRSSWRQEEGYLVLLPAMEFVWKIIGMPTPNAGNFIFRVDDFTADDWVKFVPPSDDKPADIPDVSLDTTEQAA